MTSTPHSDTTTDGIRVEAAAHYQPDASAPDDHRYLFEYRIRITNTGEARARLLTRHWIILDANNVRDEVRGAGVVGQHPDLGPGESHEYTSSCPLRTAWGTMEGSFTFERPDGSRFSATVGRFLLVPNAPPKPAPRSHRV